MSSHDTLQTEGSQVCTGQARIIEETSELLLQACRLYDGASPEQWSQTEQNEATLHRGRGRPQRVCWTHLWSSLLLCAL